MVQVHTCVSIHCHQCAQPLGAPEFEAHYPTETAALDAAQTAGWLPGPGETWWCSACGPVLVCEAEGHQFTPWKPADAAESRWVGREYRYCSRCCLHESRTHHDVTLPPSVTVGDVATHRAGLASGEVA